MARDPYKAPEVKPCKCGAVAYEYHAVGTRRVRGQVTHAMKAFCSTCGQPLRIKSKWFG